MKKVSFERMVRYKNSDYVVVGKGLERIRSKSPLAEGLKTQLPMAYERIKTVLHKELDDIQIIDFWREVKIYKIAC